MSHSAKVATERPFYASRADAYDALITTPIGPWVDSVRTLVVSGGSILDAGCGTGRHAQGLAALGYQLTIVDASPQLLGIAAARCPTAKAGLADICAFDLGAEFDGVTCRGVLNDLVDDEERAASLERLASHVAPRGVLILDVREAVASRRQADGAEHKRVVHVGDGIVSFESSTTWRDGLLLVDERTESTSRAGTREIETYQFTMRPWTEAELLDGLAAVGLNRVKIRPGIHGGATDRLFVVARR